MEVAEALEAQDARRAWVWPSPALAGARQGLPGLSLQRAQPVDDDLVGQRAVGPAGLGQQRIGQALLKRQHAPAKSKRMFCTKRGPPLAVQRCSSVCASGVAPASAISSSTWDTAGSARNWPTASPT